ncbi:hypothetical protein P7C73_g891, partial [Tremellales sp. Uapishka_1]
MPPSKSKRPRLANLGLRTQNRHYQSADADYVIISSDNEAFNVHTYVLKTASTVFRNPMSLGIDRRPVKSLPEMRLEDPTLETGKVVKCFLDIIYGLPIPPPTELPVENLVAPMLLLRKYDCAKDLRLVGLVIRSYATERNDVSPDIIYSVGARVDDVEICTCAIRHCGDWKWREGDGKLASCLEGGSVLDPTSWSLDKFQNIPLKYAVGLLKATRDQESLDPRDIEWDEVADEFERVMGHFS